MILSPESTAVELRRRLAEDAPGRIQLLTGPRQMGKTTLLLSLVSDHARAVYSAGDDPASTLPGAWDRIWSEAESKAAHGRAVLLLDEIQRWPDWSVRLKGRWDRIRREKLPLHVVVSGSSALQLGKGSRESLAGRFERLTLGHWSPQDLCEGFGMSANTAVDQFVKHGSYPGAVAYRKDERRWAAYVRDAIIEPALTRDILDLAEVRKPALLRQVFAYAASSPSEIVSLQKVQGALHDRGAIETMASYLSLLNDAALVAPIERFSARVRQRSAPIKLVVLNNALATAVHPAGAPDPATDPNRWGRWVENACLAYAVSRGQAVRYWREEPFEVDGIIDGDWGSWAIEVKTGAFSEADLRGLAEFTKRHSKYRPLVIGPPGRLDVARRAGMAAVDWKKFLMTGVEGVE